MSSAPQYKGGLLKNLVTTAWKVSKYGVFSGPYFPAFGLNTKINSINIRKYPYSVWKQENTDQKKPRIWTLFTQCTPTKIKEHHVVAATTITCNDGTIQPTLSRVEIYGNYNTGNKSDCNVTTQNTYSERNEDKLYYHQKYFKTTTLKKSNYTTK